MTNHDSSITGTLGGHMGLYMGASILSLVEIIEMLILICTRSKQKRLEEKVHAQKKTSLSLHFKGKDSAPATPKRKIMSVQSLEFEY